MAEEEPSLKGDEDEQARSYPYRMLARLLASAPDRDVLDLLAGLEGDDTVFGQAVATLAKAAREAEVSACKREYQDLFIGVGRGELVPFGSFYLTGFLHEKPLARLRGDLKLLGIARQDGVHEPEDHIAALCEVLAGLITGELAKVSLAEQKRFFEQHINSWAPRFFTDLRDAKSARFYRAVGTLGDALLTIDAEAYSFVADDAQRVGKAGG